MLFEGCQTRQANYVRDPGADAPLPTADPRPPQQVRTPLPPPTIQREPTPDLDLNSEPEFYELESVLPNSSTTFDPFTFGRPGSPYGPSKLFAPGSGSTRCSLSELPMSAQFADPGDTQAVILIIGNGIECIPDIDHDKPGAALTFQFVGAPFTNPPWVITSTTATQVTITNRVVTIRFTFRITRETTFISKIEYL